MSSDKLPDNVLDTRLPAYVAALSDQHQNPFQPGVAFETLNGKHECDVDDCPCHLPNLAGELPETWMDVVPFFAVETQIWIAQRLLLAWASFMLPIIMNIKLVGIWHVIYTAFTALEVGDAEMVTTFIMDVLGEFLEASLPSKVTKPLDDMVGWIFRIAIHHAPISLLLAWRDNHCQVCLEEFSYNSDHFGYVLSCGHIMCSRYFKNGVGCFVCTLPAVRGTYVLCFFSIYLILLTSLGIHFVYSMYVCILMYSWSSWSFWCSPFCSMCCRYTYISPRKRSR